MNFSVLSLVISLIFWLGLAAGLGYCLHGIFREHKRINDEIPTVPTTTYLMNRLAVLQKRNMQLWGAVTLLFAICALSTIIGLFRSASQQSVQPVIPQTQQTDKPTEIRITPPVAATPVARPVTTVAPPSVPAANSLPYSDITEFNEKDSKQQAMIDWLKQRYESTFITYYYLQKCGLVDKADYDLIRGQLHKDLTDLHTETSSAEDNIILAANGSYNELYAQASCSDERIKATKQSYDAYMQPLHPGADAPAKKAANPQPAAAPALKH